MYRYFVLVWNPRNLQAAASARSLSERMVSVASGWARAFEAKGIRAFHAGLGEGASKTLLLDHGAGAKELTHLQRVRLTARHAHEERSRLRLDEDYEATRGAHQGDGAVHRFAQHNVELERRTQVSRELVKQVISYA